MSLLEKLFGCKHKKFSFPQTRRIGGRGAGIYIVCLKCGKEFSYDFEQMKITGEMNDNAKHERFSKQPAQQL